MLSVLYGEEGVEYLVYLQGLTEVKAPSLEASHSPKESSQRLDANKKLDQQINPDSVKRNLLSCLNGLSRNIANFSTQGPPNSQTLRIYGFYCIKSHHGISRMSMNRCANKDMPTPFEDFATNSNGNKLR